MDYGAIGKDGLSGSTPDFPQTSSFTIKYKTVCYKKSKRLYPADKLGNLTRHHRCPRSLGGKHEGENISFVPEKLHNAYHLLFANNPVTKIADIMNEHWVDPEYVLVAIPKEDLQRVIDALVSSSKY